MRILFITATRIGDAILSTGILARLIERHPGARVTLACGPAAASLFEAVPGLERLIVLDKMMASLHWVALWASAGWRYWDIVVDLRNSPLGFVTVARQHFRLGPFGRSPGHRVTQMGRVIGMGDNPPAPVLWTAPAHDALAAGLIPAGPPVLAVGPTANWRAKTWRAERFAELIERLTGPDGIVPGGRVALLGRDDDRAGALRVIESVPAERRLDLVGGLDLLQAAACLKRCAFYVGNDSGLMHLAAATGIPTLGLFGPSPDDRYAPWGPHCAVVRTDLAYDRIFPKRFDHRQSDTLMDSLSVDAAFEAARQLWARCASAPDARPPASRPLATGEAPA
ncbi:MAG: glycosyltransferase family 9 protein [Proteobacteria bacterium]|nr:glycosyltransferase family 9 protein [Pseudomonadota bacterium]